MAVSPMEMNGKNRKMKGKIKMVKGITTALVCCMTAVSMASEFKAGFARVDVTPPIGTELSGYFHKRISDGVLDNLDLNAVAFSDGTNRAVVISADIINFRAYFNLYRQQAAKAADEVPVESFSSAAVVQTFERQLQTVGYAYEVHYANSTPIRLANRYAQGHPVWCNRGVNGIEGSLSTAAGFSVVSNDRVYCVIGDLSFFYDQNALWNQNLRNNFRILLLNNGRGGIFNMLPGLEQSPARDKIVAAEHQTSAEGICRQNDVVYLRAEGPYDIHQAIDTLLYIESDRPVLLEVFTDASDDERVYKDYQSALLHSMDRP